MEYLIGKGIDRAMRFRHGRRLKRMKEQSEPFHVKDMAKRFSLFATIITGTSITVTPIHGDPPPRPYAPLLYKSGHLSQLGEHAFGWSDGESIFLPITSIHLKDKELEAELLRISIFFHAFQITEGSLEIGLKNKSRLSADNELLDLYWLIENKRLAARIKREYPKAFRHYEPICKSLFEARPHARLLRPEELFVEGFLRDSVFDVKCFSGADSAERSLCLAMDLRKSRVQEGRRGGRYRAIMPFIPYGRLLPERIKADVIFRVPSNTPVTEAADPRKNEDKASDKDKKRFNQKKEDVDEEANKNGLTLNIYDKFITWAEFVNLNRPFDDDPEDDLDKKAEDMDEISTAQIQRSTNAFFNADLEKAALYDDGEETVSLKESGVFKYPEWNYLKKAYRENYSTIKVSVADDSDRGFAEKVLKKRHGLIKKLRRQFELLTPELRPLRRQIDGNDIDIDALISATADRCAGRGFEDRLYIRDVRAARDMSALFLTDLSMSTEMWIGDKRVIEHEKEALLLLCESMKGLRDRYGVFGFSGRNRSGCRYYNIKGFDEAYGPGVRERIGALLPTGYTRMGAAIRHAASLLQKERARVRLLFIISDGKPNDMDIYEGRYGLEDTAMAIREAKQAGLTPFCLTVDNTAGEYLPRLFGKGNYVVLSDAKKLASTLPVLFARVVNGL